MKTLLTIVLLLCSALTWALPGYPVKTPTGHVVDYPVYQTYGVPIAYYFTVPNASVGRAFLFENSIIGTSFPLTTDKDLSKYIVYPKKKHLHYVSKNYTDYKIKTVGAQYFYWNGPGPGHNILYCYYDPLGDEDDNKCYESVLGYDKPYWAPSLKLPYVEMLKMSLWSF